MKSFREYLEESAAVYNRPTVGDDFAINIREECLLETYVIDEFDDGIVLHADSDMVSVLEDYGMVAREQQDEDLLEQGPSGVPRDPRMAKSMANLENELDQARGGTLPSLDQDLEKFRSRAQAGEVGTPIQWSQMSDIEKRELRSQGFGPQPTTNEAEYRGRNVPLGKKMKGDVKKSKVYVKKPNGNVVKVEFGDPNMRIKKSNPARRRSFRARHNCDNPGPRWKARYWSCRAW